MSLSKEISDGGASVNLQINNDRHQTNLKNFFLKRKTYFMEEWSLQANYCQKLFFELIPEPKNF